MRHILNTKQFSKEDVANILERTYKMEEQCKAGKVEKLLQDKIVACIFFEPSTRTRLSFETAALKLGANIISAENAAANSSSYKGETIEDTSKMLNCYADLIVIRHPKMGEVEDASKVSDKPVINAGDGANQHPTQALLDLYTIKKEHKRLNDISIAFVGDVLNSRPLRSLVPLLLLYPGSTFYFVSPKELVLPEDYKKYLVDSKVNFVETDSLEEVLPKIDVLYMTRVQKERFTNLEDYEKVKDSFLLKLEHVSKLKKEAIIMHPLPRVNEIDSVIDRDPRAAYFRQAQNGLYMRMALLCYCLNL
ncbi:aspartate carbamoyltransferase [Candidatus Nomurabacteria bacterium RIFCSPHIGHO2_01_FULL_42_15]|uniref:Aspartate carbamoyltransferase n=1 Tax=Candidatus Nomurabacteria bacterium RIFCSPHIGHO2_01_FULL_42_15 TaxID=1801742 RepID=A0A1F6VDX4_9BACT|nr:MAG: aspartate carbamoyltransferase [Candidatus Nomurabacteria bacterium RIFCSPHIGHO2_01_FULL_42_15]OGI92915.1 MAG: aspartate carbamoyltransferase [Candidatus Nomurabacteria bacterium RIFCSPLOWO2_01_FULL_41_18]